MRSVTISGVILLSCVMLSLVIANSSLGYYFERLLAAPIGIQIAGYHLRYSILSWINDGLMAVFFLMVGLEIKREMVKGELASAKKAALPIVAAIGGALTPALIYHLFNQGAQTAGGWGIPMATDIAFALAIISLLGKNVPLSLKIFLAALAIVDDLIAILVIAVFYTHNLHIGSLLIALGLFLILLFFNQIRKQNLLWYLIPGIFIWYFIHQSGIHPTIAGVLIATTVPIALDKRPSPLQKLEHHLQLPVNLIIMPLFALANTNIRFETSMLQDLNTPLGLGIILGLLVGKPIGITLTSWVFVKLKIASLPNMASWSHMLGVGLLAGIGFTMSVFIALLSFKGKPELMSEAKFAILVASTLSAIFGSVLLKSISGRRKPTI
ncbi:sodium/proton antiporter, NhaA family [bacterium A37T11]|nr:sodium/proton antiporter, NhaA family [bacterium A37T11]